MKIDILISSLSSEQRNVFADLLESFGAAYWAEKIRVVNCSHNGIPFSIEWLSDSEKYKPCWFLRLGEYEFPFGNEGDRLEDLVERVKEFYIGDPPPLDHSKIWGGYTCQVCGAKNVRLWREYQVSLEGQVLRCKTCCESHEGKELKEDSDQIGWSVPAIPTSDGETFWGYTSVPLSAVNWWKDLSNG